MRAFQLIEQALLEKFLFEPFLNLIAVTPLLEGFDQFLRLRGGQFIDQLVHTAS